MVLSDLPPKIGRREKRLLTAERYARTSRAYSEADKQLLIKLLAYGLSSNEIVERTSFINRVAVYAFCRLNGLPLPHDFRAAKISDDDIEKVRHLLNHERLTYKMIGERLSWTTSKVAGIVWRYGLNGMKERPEIFELRYGQEVSHKHRCIKKPKRQHAWKSRQANAPFDLTDAG
jgi:hypothetical protein